MWSQNFRFLMIRDSRTFFLYCVFHFGSTILDLVNLLDFGIFTLDLKSGMQKTLQNKFPKKYNC